MDLSKNRIGIYFPHIIFLSPSSCLLLSPLCQGDDPLGSIHLRGSVVTAVEFVPDGEYDCCHRKHMPHVASSLTSCDQEIYMYLLFTISGCFQPLFWFQPKNTTLTATSLRSSPQMRLTTSFKRLLLRKERSGSKQCRQCQKVGSNSWEHQSSCVMRASQG